MRLPFQLLSFYFIFDRPRLHLLITLFFYLQEMSPDIRRKVDAARAVRLARETEMKNKMTAQVCDSTIFSIYSSGSNLVCSALRLNFAIIATLFHVLIAASGFGSDEILSSSLTGLPIGP